MRVTDNRFWNRYYGAAKLRVSGQLDGKYVNDSDLVYENGYLMADNEYDVLLQLADANCTPESNKKTGAGSGNANIEADEAITGPNETGYDADAVNTYNEDVVGIDRINSDYDYTTQALRPNYDDKKLASLLTDKVQVDENLTDLEVGDLIVVTRLADDSEHSFTNGPRAKYVDINGEGLVTVTFDANGGAGADNRCERYPDGSHDGPCCRSGGSGGWYDAGCAGEPGWVRHLGAVPAGRGDRSPSQGSLGGLPVAAVAAGWGH